MSTTEKIENIKTETEFLKNSIPAMAKNMASFKKADELMNELLEIAENQNMIIREFEKNLREPV